MDGVRPAQEGKEWPCKMVPIHGPDDEEVKSLRLKWATEEDALGDPGDFPVQQKALPSVVDARL